MAFELFHPISGVDESFIYVQRLYEVVDGTFVYHRVTLVSACFVMCLTFGCQALTMVFEFFDQMREVDTCCKCIKTL